MGDVVNMGIREYFDSHPDQRMLVKYGVICIGGVILTYAGSALAGGQVPVEYVAFYTAALAWFSDKFKLLNPLEPWPVIGAGKRK